MENYEEICKHHEDGLKSMWADNVTLIDAVTRTSQKFIWDDVHLNEESGRNFVDNILRASSIFFGAEFVDLDMEREEVEMKEVEQGEPSKRMEGVSAINGGTVHENVKFGMMEKRVERLERKIDAKKWCNCLMSARMREDLDAITNEKKRR